MKKILLSFVLLLACVGGWAQVLNFTFTRNGENVDVNVTGADGVTATITAISPKPQDKITTTGVWNTSGSMAADTNVLCTSTNSKDATVGAPITYTLTINGLAANQAFNKVTFVSKAVSGGGAYQSANTSSKHYCNLSLTANHTPIETKEQVGIMVNSSAGVTKEVAFNTKDVTANSEGELVLTLKIWNHSDNPGCFYGLTEIKVVNYSTLLENLINEAQTLCEAVEGKTDVPGYYTVASVNALKAAIEDASDSSIEAELGFNKLQEAINGLEVVLPSSNKFYRLISAATTNSRGKNVTMVADRKNNMATWKEYGDEPNFNADIDNLWQFVDAGNGKYNLKAVNGGYLANVQGGSAPTSLVDDVNSAGDYSFGIYSVGVCKLYRGSAKADHLWADGTKNGINVICGWEAGAASNSAWYIVPATNIDVVVNEYASIYLPFAVKVEGAQAYAIESTNATHAVLTEKADIPAAQGAILAGNGTATLNIVAAASSDWTNNKLNGSTVNTYIDKEAYVLAKNNGVVGFYKAELNKKEDGTDGETHFLNNANKAYLPVANVNAARFLSFDFGTETAIEGVEGENGNVKTEIYDLAGRRVKAAQKGLYIVNGKVVIK